MRELFRSTTSSAYCVGLLLTTAVCAAGVAWAFFFEGDSPAWRHASYAAAYALRDMPAVKDVRVDGEELVLVMSGVSAERWEIQRNGGRGYTVDGPHPRLRPEGERSEFTVVGIVTGSASATRIRFRVAVGQFPDSLPILASSSVPVGVQSAHEMADFVIDTTQYPETERQDAVRVLESIGVRSYASTLDKIGAIAGHVAAATRTFRGSPDEAMRSLTPWRQLERARSGACGLYCANLTEIYAFLANEAGIPTRIIDATGRVGHADLSAHTFAESYVPELLQWAYVDVALGMLHVRTPDGDPLDAAEIMRAHGSGTWKNLMVAQIDRADRVSTVDYVGAEGSWYCRLYLNPSASLVYHWAGTADNSFEYRVSRYLWNTELGYSATAGTAGNSVNAVLLATLATLGLSWSIVGGVLIVNRRRARHFR